MLFAVLEVTPVAELSVTLPLGSDAVCTSADHLRCFANVLCLAGQVALATAFVASKYFTKQPDSLFATDFKTGEVFKREVQVFSTAWNAIAPTVASFGAENLQAMEIYSAAPSIADLCGWFDRAAAIGPLWTMHLLTATAKLAADLSSELQKITPVYAHYITETRITPPMVKRHLLANNVRQPLAEKVVALVHVSRAAKALKEELAASTAVPAAVGDAVAADEDFAGWQHTLAAAKTALSVIAGCVILYEGGSNQQEEAKKLTARDRPDMPRSLWHALKRVGDHQGGPAPIENTAENKAEQT